MGEFLAPARPGNHGYTGGGKTPPPTVPSMRHSGAMARSEWDASANRAMQERRRAKEMVPGSDGGEGGHIQGIQSVWMYPGDVDLFQIIAAAGLSGRR